MEAWGPCTSWNGIDHAKCSPECGDREIHRAQIDANVAFRGVGIRRGLVQHAAVTRHETPTDEDLFSAGLVQILEDHEVGEPARRDASPVAESEVFRRIQRRHTQRGHRLQPLANRLTHDMVDGSV